MEESSSNQEDFINKRDEMKIQSTEEREEGYDSDPNSENNDNDNNDVAVAVESIGDLDVNLADEVVVVHQVVVDQNQQNLDEKNCWVCFASEEDDPSASWTHPCK